MITTLAVFETFSDMLNMLTDPQRLHAATVHMPIGFTILGLLAVIAMAINLGKNNTLRWATVILFLLAATTGWIAVITGESTYEQIEHYGQVSETAHDLIHEHEELAEKMPPILLGVAVAVALTAIPNVLVRILFLVVALLGSMGVTGAMSVVGHWGGELVYVHGVGVPTTDNNFNLSPELDDTLPKNPEDGDDGDHAPQPSDSNQSPTHEPENNDDDAPPVNEDLRVNPDQPLGGSPLFQ